MKRKTSSDAPTHYTGPRLPPPYDDIAVKWSSADRLWLRYGLKRREGTFAPVTVWADDRGRENCIDLIRTHSLRAWRLIIQSPARAETAGARADA